MSKFTRVVVGVLFSLGAVAGPTVLGAETAVAKRDIWCC